MSACHTCASATGLHYFHSEFETGLRVTASTPFSAMVYLESYALLGLRDLIYIVSGSISFWFGLSFMYLNPSKLKHTALNYKLCKVISMRRILSLIFTFCCMTGFVVHIYLAAVDHFMYKTSSEITVEQNDTLRYPSALVCFSFLYFANGSITFSSKNALETPRLPTVKRLYHLVPDANEFITHCSVNHHLTSSLKLLPKNQCLSSFDIKKAVTGSNVCYLIVPKAKMYYSWKRTASRLRHTNEVYGIRLNSSFSDADLITVTYFQSETNDPNRIPTYSRHYSKRFILERGFKGDSFRNYLKLYAEKHKYHYLPPPYYPGCDERPNAYRCLRECVLTRDKELNVVPFSELIFEPSDLRMLHWKDQQENATFQHIMMKIGDECRAQCSLQPCYYRVSFTEGHDFVIPDVNQYMLHFFTSTAPELIITTLPKQLLQEFLLYLSNCIGIWFGISVLSLNPTNLFKRKISR